MYTLSVFFVFSATAAALPLADAQACACCGTYKVIRVDDGDGLNVRSGPGMNYYVRAQLAPGEGCIVKTGRRRGSWVEVDAVGGRGTGWVQNRFLGVIR